MSHVTICLGPLLHITKHNVAYQIKEMTVWPYSLKVQTERNIQYNIRHTKTLLYNLKARIYAPYTTTFFPFSCYIRLHLNYLCFLMFMFKSGYSQFFNEIYWCCLMWCVANKHMILVSFVVNSSSFLRQVIL